MRYFWKKGNSEGDAVAVVDESGLAGVDFAGYQSGYIPMTTSSPVTAVGNLSTGRDCLVGIRTVLASSAGSRSGTGRMDDAGFLFGAALRMAE